MSDAYDGTEYLNKEIEHLEKEVEAIKAKFITLLKQKREEWEHIEIVYNFLESLIQEAEEL